MTLLVRDDENINDLPVGILSKYQDAEKRLLEEGAFERAMVEKHGDREKSIIEVKLPDGAKQYVLDDTTEKMREVLLLYPSIANDNISYGKAAELLGMNKMELIQLYGSMGIPYLDMTDDEFKEELQTVKRRIGERL